MASWHVGRALKFTATGCALALAGVFAVPAAATAQPGASPQGCPAPAAGQVSCAAAVAPGSTAVAEAALQAAGTTPAGLSPANLRNAYSLSSSTTGGMGQTVAVVTAYDDATAETDMATYRSEYSIPACGTGCFTKVNETGGTTYPPAGPAGWSLATAEALDMISAVCPNCHIVLVEASSTAITDLGAAENEAVALGARFVTNTWFTQETGSELGYDSEYFDHPGVAITAPDGNGGGYGAWWPAASPDVIAVGGTTLTQDTSTPRGWAEVAWDGTGSGCSAYEPKPSWQSDTGCTARMLNDVSAVADPSGSPVAFYDTSSGDWVATGGNIAASAIIAATYALAGTLDSDSDPAAYLYANPGDFYDITSGSNGTCPVAYWCNAGPGYDGPTGLGTPDGAPGFQIGANSPSVAMTGNGTAYVFWKGTDGNLWEAQGAATGALSGPDNRGMGTLGSQPAAGVDSSGHLYVYWEGTDTNLWEAYWNGSAWAGPFNRGEGTLGSAPAVAVTGSGTAYVFWKGTDGDLWEAQGPADGALGAATELDMGTLGSPPAAGVDSSGHPYVYWKGTDGNLWEAYWNGSAWAGPDNQKMGQLGSAPTVAVTGTSAYVFWKGTDGNLWEAQGPAAGTLSGPYNHEMGTLGSAPTAGVNSSGSTYVYWKGLGPLYELYEGYWNGSGWTGPDNRGMGPLG
jgi:hypothetical protein